MTGNGFIQIALYCVIVTLLVKPFGFYMTCVFNGERTFLSPLLRPFERLFYKLSGVKEDEEQGWLSYGLAMLTFSVAGFIVLYALQRLQAVLPFNPQHLDPVVARSRLQHVGEFRDQHQLAILCARDHHELFDSDGRSHHA